MSLELSPQSESLLAQEASRAGVSVDTLIARTFARPAAPQPDQKALELMAVIRQWQAEDTTDDPDELDRREQETAAHHAALDQYRREGGMRLLFPNEGQL